MEAVGRVFPRAVLQWEDFKQHNALRVLARYRHRFPCFNDDVQGTGAVVLAGLLAARAERGGIGGGAVPLPGRRGGGDRDRRAGAASADRAGQPAVPGRPVHDPARLEGGRHHPALRPRRRPAPLRRGWGPARGDGAGRGRAADPVAVARAFRPTVLLGTTGSRGAFSEALVREVARHDPRTHHPAPLESRATAPRRRRSRCCDWTDGRALIATGSPFPPVALPGGDAHDRAGQQRLHLPRRRPGGDRGGGARADR